MRVRDAGPTPTVPVQRAARSRRVEREATGVSGPEHRTALDDIRACRLTIGTRSLAAGKREHAPRRPHTGWSSSSVV